jgi:hypothetical protein
MVTGYHAGDNSMENARADLSTLLINSGSTLLEKSGLQAYITLS